MKINVHTSFGNLKSVIVGREQYLESRNIEKTFTSFYSANLGRGDLKNIHYKMEEIERRNKDLDNLAKVLESLNIKVFRPNPLKKFINFKTPTWNGFLTSPSNTRDISICYKDYLIETPMTIKGRYFENSYYEDLFKNLEFKHIRSPHFDMNKKLDCSEFDLNNAKYNSEFYPGIDGANMIPLGKKMIVNISSQNEYNGFLWFKQFFNDTKFILFNITKNHIDGDFRIVRPGLIFIKNNQKIINQIPKEFKNWEIVKFNKNEINELIYGDINEKNFRLMSALGEDLNFLMINEKLAIISEKAFKVEKEMNKRGIECIKVPLIDSAKFAGGIHCSTLELEREDDFINY